MANQLVIHYLSGNPVPKYQTVIFDSIEYMSDEVSYSPRTGIITFNSLGKYLIDWQMHTLIKVSDIIFYLYSNIPNYHTYLEDVKVTPESGSIIVDVPFVGFQLQLRNQETFTANFDRRMTPKGTLIISNYTGGEPGPRGEDGKSAYEIAVEEGFIGTIEEWLDSLKGEDGQDGQDGEDGKSAYEIAVEEGYVGTIEEWLDSLKGETGEQGPQGPPGPQGLTPRIYHANLDRQTKLFAFWLDSNNNNIRITLQYATPTTISVQMRSLNLISLLDFKRVKQQGTSVVNGISLDNTVFDDAYQTIDLELLNNSTEMEKIWIRARNNDTNTWSFYEMDIFCSNGGARTDVFTYALYENINVTWTPE